MPQPLSSQIGQSASAIRTEGPARRAVRDTAPTANDTFAALLDRAGAIRGAGARPGLADDGAAGDPPAVTAPEWSSKPMTAARVAESATQPPTQSQKQRQEAMAKDDTASAQAQAAAPVKSPDLTDGEGASSSVAKKAAASSDEGEAEPSDTAAVAPVAAPVTVPPAPPVATVGALPTDVIPSTGTLSAPSTIAPVGGPSPAPHVPADASTPAGAVPATEVPAAIPQKMAPPPPAQTAGITNPATQPVATAPGAASLTPVEGETAMAAQGKPTSPVQAAASIDSAAAATSIAAPAPVKATTSGGSPPIAVVVDAVDAPDTPPAGVMAQAKSVTSDDGATAGHGSSGHNAVQPNAAFAAQLAQQDVDTQALLPTPAKPTAPGLGQDAMLAAADAGSKADALTHDEIAPAHQSITPTVDAGGAPSRIDAAADTPAVRSARMSAHPAIAQVAVSVTKAVQEGVDRITIKLQPPELGRIDVKLEIGVDGRIQAVFAAERPATVEILQRDVRELERALQNAGLSTDAGGLSFGLKQNGGQNANAFAAFQRDNLPGPGPQADDHPLPAPGPMGAAADGRVDIHV